MPFQKGNKWAAKSGDVRNPLGKTNRPIISFTSHLRDIANQIISASDGSTCAKKLAQLVWSQALKGRIWAIAMIAERVDGKIKETLQLESSEFLQEDVQISVLKAQFTDLLLIEKNSRNGRSEKALSTQI